MEKLNPKPSATLEDENPYKPTRRRCTRCSKVQVTRGFYQTCRSCAAEEADFFSPGKAAMVLQQHTKYLALINHAVGCASEVCLKGGCKAMRVLFAHMKNCVDFGPCVRCFAYYQNISLHVMFCTAAACAVPRCGWLKIILRNQYKNKIGPTGIAGTRR